MPATVIFKVLFRASNTLPISQTLKRVATRQSKTADPTGYVGKQILLEQEENKAGFQSVDGRGKQCLRKSERAFKRRTFIFSTSWEASRGVQLLFYRYVVYFPLVVIYTDRGRALLSHESLT